MNRVRAKLLAAALAAVMLMLPLRQALALDVSANGAVLIEAATGKVLYAKNAHQRMPMASTTKVMTALLAIERGSMDETIEADASAYGIEGSSIYLEHQEKIKLRDLLYGLMLSSGNDAAVAIAVHIGGSKLAFADMMNRRAMELGARNTNFVTPNGLHDEKHYTTAYDLAMIAAEAMKHPEFRKIVSTEYYRAESGAKPRTFKNKNRILWEYPGGTGIKTGFTKAAGRCLVFSAMRDNMEVIGVVLNCPNMFEDAKAMLSYGLDNYENVTMVKAGQRVAKATVYGGEKKQLELVAGADIIVPIERGESVEYRTRVILPDTLHAPICKGDSIGYIEVLDGETLLCRCDVAAGEDVPDAGISFYFDRIIKKFVA